MIMNTHLTYALALTLLTALPLDTLAEPLPCERLDVTISGSLPTHATKHDPRRLDRDFADRPVIAIPLNQINAEDARVSVRLTRTQESIWVVELQSTNESYPATDDAFVLTGLRIDFDDEGKQEAPQMLFIEPPTNKSDLPTQSVAITFDALRVADDGAGPSIVTATTSKHTCTPDGRDVTNIANQGQPPRVQYYSPGEGERAMGMGVTF